jgi:hypothetical protein
MALQCARRRSHHGDTPYSGYTVPKRTVAHSKNQSDEGELFVLRYDDLDFQNIFCDPETGEVTGIIDW